MTRVARIGTAARFTAGAAVAAATLVVVGGGVAFGWMPHRAAPASVAVAPAAADSVLTCGGPLLAIGRTSEDVDKLAVAAEEHVTASGSGVERDTLSARGLPDDAGPTRLLAVAEGRTVPLAVGASSASVAAADLQGFAASACAPALMESWLVGGATTTGSSDLVLLANPGAVTATVNLTFYGADGAQQPGAGAHIVIGAGQQRVIPLAGLGLQEAAPAVRVTAMGAPVRAALQSSITRGLTASGIDQEGAIAAADTTQVITGVRVTKPPQDNPTTILRLLAPGEATTAAVTVVGAQGAVGKPKDVPLTAGSPAELELDGLAPGSYTVLVKADQPVAGAVWQATGTGKGDDFAWVTSSPQLPSSKEGTVFAVPSGESPYLVLTPSGEGDVKVAVAPAGGGAAVTAVAAGGRAAAIKLSAGVAYRLTADAPVHAAVTFAGAGQLASFPVWPQDAASAPVVVYP